MQVHSEVSTIRSEMAAVKEVALVPTMGNLHEGHLGLVKLAQRNSQRVVVSIFVNALQFGPAEDYQRYPRTLSQDLEKLKQLGVDFVFAPADAELFPSQQTFYVTPSEIADQLCGAFRPGHFRGVATIVLKLFHIIMPQVAVFGKKDYQQLHIIKELTTQFNLPIAILAGETARDSNGLALSSRNQYLSSEEQREATRLYRVLESIVQQIQKGSRNFKDLEMAAAAALSASGWRPEYISVRNSATLELAREEDKELVVLGAAWLGNTRLIDNLEIKL